MALSDDDLMEMTEGMDTYLATCIKTFDYDTIAVMSVMMARLTQVAQAVGGEDEFLLLLNLAKKTIINGQLPRDLN